MKLIRNPELKGILVILLIIFVLAVLLAGTSGKLEQWGLPWFTGAKAVDKIVFVSDRSGTKQIYIMNLDGSEQKQLTRDATVLSAPAISPAGNRIVYVGMSGSMSQVFAIGVNGGTPYALTSSTSSKRQPGFSPDAKKLSFIESGRVFVAEISGSNPDPVLPTEQELAVAMNNPMGRGALPVYTAYAWGPDSESMAGVTSDDKGSVLSYLPTLEGEVQRFALGDPTAKVVGMSWATDTPLLVASIQIGNRRGLVVAFEPGQKQPRPLLSRGGNAIGAPAVSPDGSTAVVPVVQVDMSYVLRIDLQSGKVTQLYSSPGYFESLTFSPGGNSILAQQRPWEGKHRIITIDPDSGKMTVLANDGDCFDAVWSPQSQ